jgi:hypothetical protein
VIFRKLVLFPILLLILSLRADASVWSKTLDGIRGDYGQSASPTSDGGAILSGTTKGGHEAYLIKMNSTGNIQWQKIFGRPGVNKGVQLSDAIQTNNGYVAAGTVSEGVLGTADLFVVSTNSQGIVNWMRIYSMAGDEFGYKIRETRDGGFMIAGHSFPSSNEANILLIRMDSQGTIRWQKILDPGGYDVFPDLQTTSDGNFILAASTTFLGEDAVVMKFDDAGNIIWSKTYSAPGNDGALGIRQTSDGGYVVSGWAQGSINTLDVWVFKLTPSGNIQWQNQYGGAKNDSSVGVTVGKDGNFFVTGYTLSFGSGREDVWVLKLSPTGQVLFEKTYGGPKGDWPVSISLSRDGGTLVTGLNQLPSRAQQTAFVVKLNSSGELNACSRLTLADSKATVRSTAATTQNVQFNIMDPDLLELPTDEIRITNGIMKSITDCNLITGINPSAATPGSVIELTGVGFGNSQADSKIFIGKRDTGKAISWSDTKIVFRLPNDAQTAGVILQNNSGKTVPIEFPILPPAGKTLWPLDGPPQGKTRVVIALPANFDGLKVDRVQFGNNEATNISLVSRKLLLCTSPAGTGSVPVTVFRGTDSFVAGNFIYK